MAYTYQYFKLDVNAFNKLPEKSYIYTGGALEGQKVYISEDSIKIGNEVIVLCKQRTNYGEKTFFICDECLSKRRYLYYINGHWKCRECGNLKYISTSTYRNGMDYCDLKIEKILNKLKVEHKIEYYTGDLVPYIKPYKMRWNTFSKLISELKYWQQERESRWLRIAQTMLRK